MQNVIARGPNLAFVVHDDRENLTFMQYAPSDAEARGGNRLVVRGDFNCSCLATSFSSFLCQTSLTGASATSHLTYEELQKLNPINLKVEDAKKFGLVMPTLDGGMNSIIPVAEKTYRRLFSLQTVMTNALETTGGLNARGSRIYRPSFVRGGTKGVKVGNVLDGQLLNEYCNLERSMQVDLCRSIGSSVDLIMDGLVEIGYNCVPL